MSGIPNKIVIDTNVLFMAIYDSRGKAGKIIEAAHEKRIELLAPISVREELTRILKRELKTTESETEFITESLPIQWIEKEIYQEALPKTTVKHKPDKAVEALAMILDCGILTADKHFEGNKHKININNLLARIKK